MWTAGSAPPPPANVRAPGEAQQPGATGSIHSRERTRKAVQMAIHDVNTEGKEPLNDPFQIVEYYNARKIAYLICMGNVYWVTHSQTSTHKYHFLFAHAHKEFSDRMVMSEWQLV